MAILYFAYDLFFLIAGITFLLAAFLEFFIKNYEGTTWKIKEKTKESNLQSIIIGLKYIYTNKLIFYSLLFAMVGNIFTAGMNLYLPFITIKVLNQEAFYGIILTIQMLGSLTAPILFKTFPQLTKICEKIDINYLVFGGAIPFIFAYPNVYVLAVIYFIINLSSTAYTMNFYTYLQINVVPENIGKVISTVYSMALLATLVGMFIFGLLGDYLQGYALIFIGITFTLSLSILTIFLNRVKRQLK